MPVLTLQNDETDAGRLLGVMYFPTDAGRREAIFEPVRADGVAAVAANRRATLKEQRLTLELSDAGWRGTVAGSVLAYLAVMTEQQVAEPSVRKAVEGLQRHANSLVLTDDGSRSDAREDKRIPKSEKSIWNFWNDFRSVCHLWAAQLVLEKSVPFYAMEQARRACADPRLRPSAG